MLTTSRLIVLLIALALLCPLAPAQTSPWVNISDGLMAQLAQDNKKPAYAGPCSGVAVDPASGDLYLVVNDLGLFKSTDRGATYQRVDNKTIGGRCETGFALHVDPAGGKLMAFIIYGSSAITLDAGKTFAASKTSHLDAGQVHWPDASMVAIKHESGGEMILSPDAGKTWQSVGKGFKTVGLFDAKTLVASKATGILRSTDGGANWSEVSPLKPVGLAMRARGGAGYWLSDQGVIVSRDSGATWALLGSPVKATLGPYFGKDDNHLLVAGKEGVSETTDAGKTWKVIAPLPPGFDGGIMCSFAYDAKADVLYASRMTKPAYRWQRGG